MLRKTSAAAAVIAFATVGSALFGGVALANDGDAAPPTFTGGEGGKGGDAKTVCFVVGDQEFKEKNTVGSYPGAHSLACYSTGGAGGAGGAGANFTE